MIAMLASALLISSCKFGFSGFLFNEEKVDERASSITTLSEYADVPYMGAPPDSTKTSFPEYSAVIITDVHFGSSEDRNDDKFLENFESLFESSFESSDIKNWPRFVVCLGDSSDTGNSDEFDDYNEFVKKICAIGNAKWGTGTDSTDETRNKYSFHVYTVLGNHDLYNDGWSDWEDKICPHTSYYRINICGDSSSKGCGLYFLDTANGTTGANQLEDFESRVGDDSRLKIVFTHYPVYCGGVLLWTIQDTSVRNRLITAFANNNVKYVFEGHVHKDHSYDFGKFKERVIASYLYNREYCIVKINETSGTVTSELVSY